MYTVDLNTALRHIVDEETGEVLVTEAFFKTPWNHDTNVESNRTGLLCTDRSLVDESFKDESDINLIVQRVMKGMEVPVVLPEHFGNADDIPTLLDARTRIAETNAIFYNLPPKLRERFNNDPGYWEHLVIQELGSGNAEQLRALGVDPSNLLPETTQGALGGSPAPAAPGSGSPAPAGDAAPPTAPQGAK